RRTTTTRRRAIPRRFDSSARIKSCARATDGARRARGEFPRKSVATSDSLLRASPTLSPDAAADLARLHFGLDGHALPLPSERDQNFLILAGGEPRAVLKVASAAEDRGILEAQQAALAHLAHSVATTPRVLGAKHGTSLVEMDGDDGRMHL